MFMLMNYGSTTKGSVIAISFEPEEKRRLFAKMEEKKFEYKYKSFGNKTYLILSQSGRNETLDDEESKPVIKIKHNGKDYTVLDLFSSDMPVIGEDFVNIPFIKSAIAGNEIFETDILNDITVEDWTLIVNATKKYLMSLLA